MGRRNRQESVSIRPGVRVLSVLRHLNYKPWFALAEFVDNSLQSYLDNRSQLRKVSGKNFKLKVFIKIEAHDGGRITVRDNAAGIHRDDYARAFRAAEVPPDSSGLSEFGMGMKSAACWFAPIWSVRTKALGETEEKIVGFDIKKILRDSLEELDVETRKTDPQKHYTEIVLSHLYSKAPHGRTLGKIREHLAGIYRMFTRDGTLELYLNGDPLTYFVPAILKAPYHKNTSGKPLLWKKEIDFTVNSGRRVVGFAALRETGSTSEAGFALFRRRRLIQGSADEGYRPEFIFGQPNTYAFQRLFGELELTGFNVSHTKDGFRWGEDEDAFLAKLKQRIAAPPIPLLDQAQNYRAKPSRQLSRASAASITERTAQTIEGHVPKVLGQLERAGLSSEIARALPSRQTLARRTLAFQHDGVNWEIALELSDDPAVGDWVELGERGVTDRGKGPSRVRQLQIRFSVDHPFTAAFAGANAEQLEPQLRIAAAIALAEVVARESGIKGAGTFRRSVNDLLRNALSK
jgi:Histidine kinase-, DNA gyrase B-, and HSP90-like ATPase